MTDRRTQLINAVEVLTSLLRSIILKRALHTICSDPPLNFWRVIYGNLMDVAVLEWCKLFGSDGELKQPIHWKNVADDPAMFKEALLNKLGVTDAQWVGYWEQMKKYRDLNVAHFDPRRREIESFPTLEIALASSYFYFSYVREELKKFGVSQYPDDIEAYGQEFANKCHEAASAALNATRHIIEPVSRGAGPV